MGFQVESYKGNFLSENQISLRTLRLTFLPVLHSLRCRGMCPMFYEIAGLAMHFLTGYFQTKVRVVLSP